MTRDAIGIRIIPEGCTATEQCTAEAHYGNCPKFELVIPLTVRRVRWEDSDDGTCGDCIDGRCHFGGDGPAPGDRCGCDRHDASVQARTHDDGHQAD
jgi:hypothetical protein